jgi:hypothetical protein
MQIDHVEKIRTKAQAHKDRHPTFDLERFMAWVQANKQSWHRWASGRSIAQLNKSRRSAAAISRMCRDD